MALFKVLRGNSTNLPKEKTDGWAYFCTDTGEFFIDYDTGTDIERVKVNPLHRGNNITSAVFNDGIAISDYSIVGGIAYESGEKIIQNRAGIKGYKVKSYNNNTGIITVKDANLTNNRAIDNYEIDDILCFDCKSHYYNKLKIQSFSSDNDGNSMITVVSTDGTVDTTKIQLDGGGDERENWIYVPAKPDAGEESRESYINFAFGEGAVAVGRGAISLGRETNAIGQYSHAEGRGTTAHYAAHAEGKGSKALGNYSHAEGLENIADNTASHAEGVSNSALGLGSHAEGSKNLTSGNYSHVEGYSNTVSGAYSHAEGSNNQITGTNAHAEGVNNNVSGANAHAEGQNNIVSGLKSHAEGEQNKVTASSAHVEGALNEANGAYSHAEGLMTKTKGVQSHAEGQGTIAASDNQHVQGKFNVEDTSGKYAHIVGWGGSDNSRKNIHTLDTTGNAVFAGKITMNGNQDVATKAEISNANNLTTGTLKSAIFPSGRNNQSGGEGDKALQALGGIQQYLKYYTSAMVCDIDSDTFIDSFALVNTPKNGTTSYSKKDSQGNVVEKIIVEHPQSNIDLGLFLNSDWAYILNLFNNGTKTRIQIAWTYTKNPIKTAIRQRWSDNWTEWQEIGANVDSLTINNNMLLTYDKEQDTLIFKSPNDDEKVIVMKVKDEEVAIAGGIANPTAEETDSAFAITPEQLILHQNTQKMNLTANKLQLEAVQGAYTCSAEFGINGIHVNNPDAHINLSLTNQGIQFADLNNNSMGIVSDGTSLKIYRTGSALILDDHEDNPNTKLMLRNGNKTSYVLHSDIDEINLSKESELNPAFQDKVNISPSKIELTNLSRGDYVVQDYITLDSNGLICYNEGTGGRTELTQDGLEIKNILQVNDSDFHYKSKRILHEGNFRIIPEATAASSGLMSAEDKQKLDQTTGKLLIAEDNFYQYPVNDTSWYKKDQLWVKGIFALNNKYKNEGYTQIIQEENGSRSLQFYLKANRSEPKSSRHDIMLRPSIKAGSIIQLDYCADNHKRLLDIQLLGERDNYGTDGYSNSRYRAWVNYQDGMCTILSYISGQGYYYDKNSKKFVPTTTRQSPASENGIRDYWTVSLYGLIQTNTWYTVKTFVTDSEIVLKIWEKGQSEDTANILKFIPYNSAKLQEENRQERPLILCFGPDNTQNIAQTCKISNVKVWRDRLWTDSIPYRYQTDEPIDKNVLWVDTDTSSGGLKYYNVSGNDDQQGWKHVPVAWT